MIGIFFRFIWVVLKLFIKIITLPIRIAFRLVVKLLKLSDKD